MEKSKLYIPVHTPDADDYIAGIGTKELGIIAVAIIGAIIVGITVTAIKQNTLYGVFVGMIIIAAAILIFRRDPYNENIIKKLRLVNSFVKAPKRYIYQFYDVYKEYEDEELEAYE
ncbi:MAG: hypothetical protein LIP16_20580 [Clostridium sp.]|nr:hypothetical protein [Clostridium sp.]